MKKNRKCILTLLLMLLMVVSVACTEDGGNTKKPVDVSGDSSVTSEAVNSDTENTQPQTQPAQEVTLAETQLYNENGIVVTATGMEDGWMGPEITLLVENNTDRNLLITDDMVSINGYMMSYSSLYCEVSAGKKANESLTIMSADLKEAGIETIANLEFYLDVCDADSWETVCKTDLLRLPTSAADYVQNVDDSGDTVYDANGIKVVCKGLKQDVIWDGTVVFYIENNSETPVTVYAENVSVNGFMQDVSMWADLRSGTRSIDGMSLLDLSDLSVSSIDEVENIEFSLRIINADSWEEIATTDPITLTF